MTSFELQDGQLRQVPDQVISESGVFEQDVAQTLRIAPGIRVATTGTLNGTVHVGEEAEWIAAGDVNGAVEIASGATAVFQRRATGTISILRGASATFGPDCVALGMIHVEGALINEGTRGVNVHGPGTVSDLPGSQVRQPDEVWPDGTTFYFS